MTAAQKLKNEPLNNSSMRVEWDAKNKHETEDAKSYYIAARAQHRSIETLDGQPLLHFSSSLEGFIIKETELAPEQFALHLIDETGDRRLIWDSTKPHEVKDAVSLFDEYIKKGWKAYAVDLKGNRGKRISRFDADTEEIFFDDISTGDKLRDFVASIPKSAKPSEVKVKDFVNSFKAAHVDTKTVKQKLKDFVASFKEIKLVPRTYPG